MCLSLLSVCGSWAGLDKQREWKYKVTSKVTGVSFKTYSDRQKKICVFLCYLNYIQLHALWGGSIQNNLIVIDRNNTFPLLVVSSLTAKCWWNLLLETHFITYLSLIIRLKRQFAPVICLIFHALGKSDQFITSTELIEQDFEIWIWQSVSSSTNPSSSKIYSPRIPPKTVWQFPL